MATLITEIPKNPDIQHRPWDLELTSIKILRRLIAKRLHMKWVNRRCHYARTASPRRLVLNNRAPYYTPGQYLEFPVNTPGCQKLSWMLVVAQV